LIAFVVVAAVFSYVVLGAGFFTTQKSQEVVHSGVAQASSSLELIGDVYGIQKAATNTKIDTLEFAIGLTAGGSIVDLDKTTLTYSDSNSYYTLTKRTTSNLGNKEWCIYLRKPGTIAKTKNVLESGEQYTIRAKLDPTLGVNHKFTLEIKPSTGATFGIVRTTPPQVDKLNLLY
jgi:flagellin FlaB